MTNGFDIASSTVDRDDERNLLSSKFIQEVLFEAISVVNSMGQTIGDGASDACEKFDQEGSGTYSIDIIVSENNDAFFFFSCYKDSIYGLTGIRHEKRIWELRKIGMKKVLLSFVRNITIL